MLSLALFFFFLYSLHELHIQQRLTLNRLAAALARAFVLAFCRSSSFFLREATEKPYTYTSRSLTSHDNDIRSVYSLCICISYVIINIFEYICGNLSLSLFLFFFFSSYSYLSRVKKINFSAYSLRVSQLYVSAADGVGRWNVLGARLGEEIAM